MALTGTHNSGDSDHTSDHNLIDNQLSSLSAQVAAKAAAAHTHNEGDVSSLQADLASKANSTHTHAQTDVTSLVSNLASKSATGHTHTVGDVSGLSSSVGGLTLVAQAVAATFINGAKTFLTYTVPNDGKKHLVMTGAHVNIGVGGQSGGGVSRTITTNGVTSTQQLLGASQAIGDSFGIDIFFTSQIWADPGTNITVQQIGAQTVGSGNTADIYIWST